MFSIAVNCWRMEYQEEVLSIMGKTNCSLKARAVSHCIGSSPKERYYKQQHRSRCFKICNSEFLCTMSIKSTIITKLYNWKIVSIFQVARLNVDNDLQFKIYVLDPVYSSSYKRVQSRCQFCKSHKAVLSPPLGWDSSR